MRRKLLIGVALYLAVGVVFGLVTDRQDYMCPPATPSGDDMGAVNNIVLVEAPWGCYPILDVADRARWVATAAPTWLPLVVRRVVRGDGAPIGSITLGGHWFSRWQ